MQFAFYIAPSCEPDCVLRVSVVGNQMQPLMRGMPLRNGHHVSLPSSADAPSFVGLIASNGHQHCAKPAFWNLAIRRMNRTIVAACPAKATPVGPGAPWRPITSNGRGIQVSGNIYHAQQLW
jgi:hypothetical protein